MTETKITKKPRKTKADPESKADPVVETNTPVVESNLPETEVTSTGAGGFTNIEYPLSEDATPVVEQAVSGTDGVDRKAFIIEIPDKEKSAKFVEQISNEFANKKTNKHPVDPEVLDNLHVMDASTSYHNKMRAEASNVIDVISEILGEKPIVNKAFPGQKFRPDFRFEEAKIAVWFDEEYHYQSAKRAFRDDLEDTILAGDGYKSIRIPYFVNLEDNRVIKSLFPNVTTELGTAKQGFTENSVLPADFNYLGIKRFKRDLTTFLLVSGEILRSLSTLQGTLDEEVIVPYNMTRMLHEQHEQLG